LPGFKYLGSTHTFLNSTSLYPLFTFQINGTTDPFLALSSFKITAKTSFLED
jgi:hypothetical protein